MNRKQLEKFTLPLFPRGRDDVKGRDFTMGRQLSLYGGIVLVLLGLALSVWKCQYGIDLYDETYFLPPGFKLMSLGDKPISDEIFKLGDGGPKAQHPRV